MTKHILIKSFLALFALSLASTATKTFAQATLIAPSHHTLSMGDPIPVPDPTGTGN
jgi:hypothetical protein